MLFHALHCITSAEECDLAFHAFNPRKYQPISCNENDTAGTELQRDSYGLQLGYTVEPNCQAMTQNNVCTDGRWTAYYVFFTLLFDVKIFSLFY